MYLLCLVMRWVSVGLGLLLFGLLEGCGGLGGIRAGPDRLIRTYNNTTHAPPTTRQIDNEDENEEGQSDVEEAEEGDGWMEVDDSKLSAPLAQEEEGKGMGEVERAVRAEFGDGVEDEELEAEEERLEVLLRCVGLWWCWGLGDVWDV